MLTCAYFPSENSSRDTRDAARFLIEGGTTIDIETGDIKNPIRHVLFNPETDRIVGNKLFYQSDDGKKHDFTIVTQHKAVKGIGGTFHVIPVQDIIDIYMEFSPVLIKKASRQRKQAVSVKK